MASQAVSAAAMTTPENSSLVKKTAASLLAICAVLPSLDGEARGWVGKKVTSIFLPKWWLSLMVL